MKGIDFNQSIIEKHYINIRNLSKYKYDKAVELIYTAIRKTWKDVYITNEINSVNGDITPEEVARNRKLVFG